MEWVQLVMQQRHRCTAEDVEKVSIVTKVHQVFLDAFGTRLAHLHGFIADRVNQANQQDQGSWILAILFLLIVVGLVLNICKINIENEHADLSHVDDAPKLMQSEAILLPFEIN
jgi:hypothetical protein